MFRSKLKTAILAISVTVMAASMICYPKESFDASVRGLNMWWEIVFPSLLPFFIVSEMLISFGVVTFLGILLEPIMRPVFKVPGVGGFVWAMGMASGNPAGAKLTARLRQEGQINQIEAERLVSFTNSSNPLFIFGAVSVGFFHKPQLGILLALSHYLGNICVGLIMRFYGKGNSQKEKISKKKNTFRSALYAIHQTRIKDTRPIGKLLGDAVTSSIQTLLMIGGFIILFSVINKLLFLLHITAFLAKWVEFLLSSISFPKMLSIPLISGLFEITLGSKLTSQVQNVSLLHQVMVTSFILAFAGFSVQAQVASILATTDIRFQPFFIGRFMQGIFASFFAYLLWNPLSKHIISQNHPIDSIPVNVIGKHSWLLTLYSNTIEAGPLITIISLLFYVLILSSQIKEKH
ncbi:MAG: sporulation integral membrane protein YlbJ [Bacillota bacterium]|nr:sporulation integral membrane protein YlbJ [Bacillota bacterium]